MTRHDPQDPEALADALVDLDGQLCDLADAMHTDLEASGIDPMRARSTDGGWLLAPLLVARANVLAALTQLGITDVTTAGPQRTIPGGMVLPPDALGIVDVTTATAEPDQTCPGGC